MRPPAVPCKVGVHINTSIKEYEHFVGNLVDTENPRKEWVQYEIPLAIMSNNFIQSSLIGAPVEDIFHMKGVSFHVEKQNN